MALGIAAIAAGCSSAPLPTDDASAAAPGVTAAAAPSAPSRDEWRRRMSKKPRPKDGCFHAAYPSAEWVEAPCSTPPRVPLRPAPGGARQAGRAMTVGNGTDDSSSVASGTISWAEGSFPSVWGVTSITSGGEANDFSLQLNSNPFSGSSMCSGAAVPLNCRAWQQFVYLAPSYVFMQYWLIDYGNTCPSGWWSYGSDCYTNSTASASPPTVTAAELDSVALTGTAGSSDTVTLAVGDDLYTASQASLVGLDEAWSAAEFNVFGPGGGSEAVFNSDATVMVQTLTDTVTEGTTGPACASEGFTGETNSLTLGECSAIGGTLPGIQFVESNVSWTGSTVDVGTSPAGVAFDGANVWVANAGSGNVTVRNAATGALVGTYTVPNNPSFLLYDGTYMWAACTGNSTIAKLNVTTGAIIATYEVDNTPGAMAFDGTNLWVPSSGHDEVTVLSTSGTVVAKYDVGSLPYAALFDGENVWVANNGSDTVTKLLASDGSVVGTYDVGTEPWSLAFDGANVWVANSGSDDVTELVASDGSVMGTYAVGDNPQQGIMFDGANIWVSNVNGNNVTELLASNGSVVGTYDVGSLPQGLVFDGYHVWVANYGSDTVTALANPTVPAWGALPPGSFNATIQSGTDDECLIFGASGTATYPSRKLWGSGTTPFYCGLASDADLLAKQQAIFTFIPVGEGQYIIANASDGAEQCLMFAQSGAATYPSRKLWGGGTTPFYCGFDSEADLLANGQAVWTVVQLQGNQYQIMNSSSGQEQCLVFGDDGSATYPSRYLWGDETTYCGFASLADQLANEQSVWIITPLL